MPRAASLVAELEQEFGISATLIKGGSGIFDVKLDGDMIFSKHSVGRFPDPGEVVALLKQRNLS